MSANRSSSPTSTIHPTGCGCCGAPMNTFPQFIYREFRNEPFDTFTGIVVMGPDMTCFRLNDPNYDIPDGASLDDLQGKGHVMDALERDLTLAMYQADAAARSNVRKAFSVKDIGGILQDFRDKPQDLDLPYNDCDVNFPHGIPSVWMIPQIRYHDFVLVLFTKMVLGKHVNAPGWVYILACAKGYLTGALCKPIQSPLLLCNLVDLSVDSNYEFQEGDIVTFPVTCVLGVKYGEHWTEEDE